MYRINLFRPGSATRIAVKHYPSLRVTVETRAFKPDWSRIRRIAAVTIAVNVICVLTVMPLRQTYQSLLAEQVDLTTQIETLRPAVQEAEQLQSQIDAMVESLNLVAEMAETTSNWSGVLDEIHRLLPYDAWLLRIESQVVTDTSSDDDSRSRRSDHGVKKVLRTEMVDIEGVAVNYLSFSEFLMRLRQSTHLFTNVEVISSEATPEGVQFLIRLYLHPKQVRF